MPAIINLVGRVFGRLTVVNRTAKVKGVRPKWFCKCECGNTCIARSGDLLGNKHRSCGCLHLETITIHGHTTNNKVSGHTHSRTYNSWVSMVQRCYNEKDPNYHNYGGRGIRVCQRWKSSFSNFLEDMGNRPPKTSIDRFPDMNGGYEPGNCRWATRREQGNNRRNNHRITFQGKTLTLTEWAREVNISATTLDNRLRSGWEFAKAIFTPVQLERSIDPSTGRFLSMK